MPGGPEPGPPREFRLPCCGRLCPCCVLFCEFEVLSGAAIASLNVKFSKKRIVSSALVTRAIWFPIKFSWGMQCTANFSFAHLSFALLAYNNEARHLSGGVIKSMAP